ncbi:MAG TPA: flavin reductase family protein [Pseudomonas sp.]|nr:flavin reductase [Pseudomonas sp.]HCA25827.1 flavin reductase family protein [Pseudomonas sp.]|tara:strand:+ start:2741 stop:3370 length:630 start_codon:yes stop_codon:yes gene_type:complete
MLIDTRSRTPQEMYRLMSGIVVPRPIAWISTLSGAGLVNLAPFSCFTFVSNSPPMIGVNIGRKAGKEKDTARNIRRAGDFVVNIGTLSMTDLIHSSAIEFPEDESEVDALGLETVASIGITAPRLKIAPISMECRLERVIEFGDTGAEFFVGQVETIHVSDELYDNGKIDTARLDPVCRIAGPHYAGLGDIITKQIIAQTPKTVIVDQR